MSRKRDFGDHGEDLAVEYLRSKNYEIIQRNWQCRYGELDVVAQVGETLVFCEVKTIHGENLEDAFANITPNKMKKLLKAVHYYLAAKNLEDICWRMDVIAIAFPKDREPLIDHVEDALDW